MLAHPNLHCCDRATPLRELTKAEDERRRKVGCRGMMTKFGDFDVSSESDDRDLKFDDNNARWRD
jgi:hypothetical protein